MCLPFSVRLLGFVDAFNFVCVFVLHFDDANLPSQNVDKNSIRM